MTEPSAMIPNASRRTFLKGVAGVAVGSAALGGTAAAQEASGGRTTEGASGSGDSSGGETDGGALRAWLSNTENANRVVDRRGESEVTVDVGAAGNGGSFAFSPAAVRVDPGTTVVWEWTGDGGSHNVVAENGAFESEVHDTAGATFEYAPSASGVVRYACAPHEPMGMKGALVVGDAEASLRTEAEREAQLPTFDGWLDGVDNYEGVVDARGKSEVTVDVGAAGNGGTFAFSPAAVRVSPGTRVVWRWVDAPGGYNVAARDGAFASEFVSDPGHEFARRFGTERVVKYGCEAYVDIGMRGVVVVGDGSFGVEMDDLDAGVVGTGLGLATLLSPLGLAAVMHRNGDGRRTADARGREFRPENEH